MEAAPLLLRALARLVWLPVLWVCMRRGLLPLMAEEAVMPWGEMRDIYCRTADLASCGFGLFPAA